jgi:hypothetical protein
MLPAVFLRLLLKSDDYLVLKCDNTVCYRMVGGQDKQFSGSQPRAEPPLTNGAASCHYRNQYNILAADHEDETSAHARWILERFGSLHRLKCRHHDITTTITAADPQ